jgi:hypothetical protein
MKLGPKLARELWRGGIPRIIDMAGAHVVIKERREFESRHGLDTEEVADLNDLTIEGSNGADGFYYVATPPRVVHAFLANLPSVQDFAFVDYGSGKGIVLLVASEYGFQSIRGVEFAHELHETAEQNIRKFASPRQVCHDVMSICADATQFDVPATNGVLYFSNPFSEPVMQQVLDKIGKSFAEHNQKIFVLFHQLAEEEDTTMAETLPLFEAAPFLHERPFRPRTWFERLVLRHLCLKIYETTPKV